MFDRDGQFTIWTRIGYFYNNFNTYDMSTFLISIPYGYGCIGLYWLVMYQKAASYNVDDLRFIKISSVSYNEASEKIKVGFRIIHGACEFLICPYAPIGSASNVAILNHGTENNKEASIFRFEIQRCSDLTDSDIDKIVLV